MADKISGSKLSMLRSYIGTSTKLTAQMAISWLTETSLIDYLSNFENKETAQTSIAILIFIKKRDPSTDIPAALKLSSEYIAMMHESSRENLFNGILKLANLLTQKEFDKILNVLKDIPPDEHSFSSITFVNTFSKYCRQRDSTLGLIGNIFWDIFHSENASEYIQSLAFEQFIKLIKKPYFERSRGVYFTQCVMDIDKNKSVFKSTVVMKYILDLNPGLLNMEQNNKLLIKILNIFVSSFVTYYVCTSQKVIKLKMNNECSILNDEDIENTRFEDGIPHKQQVATRLNFLGFIRSKFSVKLPHNYVTLLWNTFHDNYICDRDRNIFYGWLLNNFVQKDTIVAVVERIEKNVIRYTNLFNDCVLKHLSTGNCFISHNLFNVVIRLFIITNFFNGGIACEAQSESGSDDIIKRMYASTIALIGLDKIIFTFTRAIDNDFFIDSIKFLNSLFRKVVNVKRQLLIYFILFIHF